mmetsp:Transcript_4103/g.7268  ORF Transcript_4103/g.7268 Transcript_4103/m.7268 type:complete len:237 (+) Transcript_4103:367-1077(+)
MMAKSPSIHFFFWSTCTLSPTEITPCVLSATRFCPKYTSLAHSDFENFNIFPVLNVRRVSVTFSFPNCPMSGSTVGTLQRSQGFTIFIGMLPTLSFSQESSAKGLHPLKIILGRNRAMVRSACSLAFRSSSEPSEAPRKGKASANPVWYPRAYWGLVGRTNPSSTRTSRSGSSGVERKAVSQAAAASPWSTASTRSPQMYTSICDRRSTLTIGTLISGIPGAFRTSSWESSFGRLG